MVRELKVLLMAAVIAVGVALPAQAQETSDTARLRFYFWERVRQESWDNAMSLDEAAADTSAYVRLRTSLGALWTPGKSWAVHLRLTNENRVYLAPKLDPRLKTDFNVHEVIFDQLYVKWTSPRRPSLSLTLGRFDMMLGEGFLVMDGGPLDGSRTGYFNGLRLDYSLKNKNNLTFFSSASPGPTYCSLS
jgi:hypothetical protein